MSKMLNKRDLVQQISKKAGMTESESSKALKALIDTITEQLSKKNGIRLVGFGNFKVNHRKARKGRNPQNGKSITISARNIPQFHAGKNLKEAVNK